MDVQEIQARRRIRGREWAVAAHRCRSKKSTYGRAPQGFSAFDIRVNPMQSEFPTAQGNEEDSAPAAKTRIASSQHASRLPARSRIATSHCAGHAELMIFDLF
jgi:hypothetical protein